MDYYRINKVMLPLRDSPSPTASWSAPYLDRQDRIVRLNQALNESGQAWWHVEVLRSGSPPRRGFIPDARLEVIPAGNFSWPEEIDRVLFVSALTNAARQYGTNRDYLALVAQLESGMRNISSATSPDAVGPFRFSQAQWELLVESDQKMDSPSGVTQNDIESPWLQPLMAALLTAQNAEALLQVLKKVPTGVELYIAHVMGLDAALALANARDSNGQQSVEVALASSLNQQQSGKLLANPRAVLLLGDRQRSVSDALQAVEQKMLAAVDQVVQDIERLPEDLKFPGGTSNAAPPWLVQARREIGVRERAGNGFAQSNPRIEEYHNAAGDAKPDDVPWCASFVSFCMATSGNDLARRCNLASKRAADWLAWGEGVSDPQLGAICVLQPLVEGTSGHVGFFVRRDGAHVWLLGGNQGDSVCEKRFKATDVRGYRWLNWTEAAVGTARARDVQNSTVVSEAQFEELVSEVKGGQSLQQHARKIYASAQKWKVNPVFSLAQSAYETGWWTSSAFQDLNNVGGLSKAAHHYTDSGTSGKSENNGRRWETFDSPADSFNAKMWLLRKHYLDEGRLTIRSIIEKYAPAIENDVGGYVVSVEKIMEDMFRRLGIRAS